MQLLLLLLFPHLYPTKMCAQAIVHDKRETVLSLLPCKNNNYSSRYQACYLNRAGAHDQCLDLFKANCDLQKHTWAQKNENRHDFFNLLATKNGNVKIVQLYLVNAKRRMKNNFAREKLTKCNGNTQINSTSHCAHHFTRLLSTTTKIRKNKK